jgi:hypothetical protein
MCQWFIITSLQTHTVGKKLLYIQMIDSVWAIAVQSSCLHNIPHLRQCSLMFPFIKKKANTLKANKQLRNQNILTDYGREKTKYRNDSSCQISHSM